MKRSLSAAVAVLFLAIAVFPFSTAAGPQVTVRYWHLFGGPDVELMRKLVDDFQRAHPNIAIDMKYGRWENYYDQLTAAIAGGTGPEVAIVHSRHLPAFASDRVLIPLAEHLKAIGLTRDDFLTIPWNASFVDAKQWGLPLDQIVSVALYSNTDLLRRAGITEAPQSGADLIEVARTIKEKTGKWGVAVPFGGFVIYRLWFSTLHQNGGRLLTPDIKRAAFNTPAGVEALKYWVDLVYRHQVAPPRAMDITQGFAVGDVGMFLEGGWWYLGLIQQKGLNFRITAIPAFFLVENRAYFSNSHNFVLPRQRRENPQVLEASLTFVKWISDNSRLWGDSGSFVPARKSIAMGADYRQSMFGRLYVDILPFGVYSPPTRQMLKIEDIIIRQLEAAMLQRATPEEALSRAEREVNDLLR